MLNASDYRAGQPNMGDRLSITQQSNEKSGRSGKRSKKGILDTYGKLSDKSQENSPFKKK